MKRPLIRYIPVVILLMGNVLLRAQDKTPPVRPHITYVTVDTATNNSVIHWTGSPSPDVEQYYLYYEVKTVNGYEGVKFDSVPAPVSVYTHVNGGANLASILYSVTAVDSSGNESVRKPGLHSTVFTSLTYDSCQSRMKVAWNKYRGWGNDVSGYRILRSIGTDPFEIVTGVNGTDSIWYDQDVSENTGYRYLIQAVKNDGLESSSNIAAKFTRMPVTPSGLAVDYVTVPGENTVEISFSYTPNGEVDDFSLLRTSILSSDFQEVQTVSDLNNSSYIFTDNILTASQQFYYRVGALNGCGHVIGTSNSGVNILLTGDTASSGVILSWNNYQDWPGGVEAYQVFRNAGDGTYRQIATLSSGITHYSDDLHDTGNLQLTGELTYYVVALNAHDNNISSRSNQVKIRVNTRVIMIPDAFTPNADGKNDYFTPLFDFRPAEFLMMIYNRAGIPVFTTHDPDKGWDGSVQGNNMAQEGVYIYHIQYSSYNGTRGEKTGHVTVFYP